jgi:hypothetical protein
MKMQALSRFVGLLSVLSFLLSSAPALAGKIGPEFQANSFTAGNQQGGKVGTFGDGSFIVVWQSEAQDPDMSRGIYAQRYRPNGTKKGAEFRVNRKVANSQDSPDIAVLSDGGFVVVWNSSDSSGTDIHAQRFNPDGTRAGPEFTANRRTAGQQQRPSVAALADAGFVIVWESIDQDGSGNGIYAQRYDSDGTSAGRPFRVKTRTPGDQQIPAIAGLNNGDFVIVWCTPQALGSVGVAGQRFNANGRRLGREFRVNRISGGFQCNPSVAANGEEGFVVVWDSPDGGDTDGVRGQRYDANGRVGPQFRVNTTRADFQIRGDVVELDNDGFVVVWESYGQGADTPDEADVFGQRFDNSGQRVGDEFRINTQRAGDQREAAVAAIGNRGFVVVWQSIDQDGSAFSIFGQRYAN